MGLSIDHNVMAFLFFVISLMLFFGFLLRDYYKDDKKKVK